MRNREFGGVFSYKIDLNRREHLELELMRTYHRSDAPQIEDGAQDDQQNQLGDKVDEQDNRDAEQHPEEGDPKLRVQPRPIGLVAEDQIGHVARTRGQLQHGANHDAVAQTQCHTGGESRERDRALERGRGSRGARVQQYDHQRRHHERQHHDVTLGSEGEHVVEPFVNHNPHRHEHGPQRGSDTCQSVIRTRGDTYPTPMSSGECTPR